MTALEVLQLCHEKGIVLSANGGKLTADSPAGTLDEALRRAIRASRDQLLQLLRDAAPPPPPPSRPKGVASPLSPCQEFLWAAQSGEAPDMSMLHMVGCFALERSVSVVRLEAAWNILVARHDALRMRFRPGASGDPEQIPAPHDNVKIRVVVAASSEEFLRDRLAVAKSFRETPFDLERQAPLRVALVLGPGKQHMVLGLHHLVADGWSVHILLHELCALLDQEDMAAESPEDPPFQFQDYAVWMREEVLPLLEERQSAFWRPRIKAMPRLHALPTDFARPPVRKRATGRLSMTLPGTVVVGLRAAAQQTGASLFVMLHTAFRLALFRFGRDAQPVIAVPTANRQTRTDLEHVVGCFANKVPLHVRLNAKHSVAAAIDEGRRSLMEALANQETPFSRLLESVPGTRSWQPLSQIFFSYNSLDIAGLPLRPVPLPLAGADSDLALTLWDAGDGLEGMLEFDAALFREQTVAGLASLFRSVCLALPSGLESTPDNLDLGANVSAADYAERADDFLPVLRPGDTALFLNVRTSPLASGTATAAQECGADCRWAETLPQDLAPRCAVVFTTLHPLDMVEPLSSGRLKGARLCFLNVLPHAPALKLLQESGVDASLLLEHPGHSQRRILVTVQALAELRGTERFVPALVSGPAPHGTAGELTELLPGLRVRLEGGRRIQLPLPGPETRFAWLHGRCLDINARARALSALLGGLDLALGLPHGPNSVPNRKTEELIAWHVGEPGPLPEHDGDAVMPIHWVELTAMPLTLDGEPDFRELSRLPVLSQMALATLPGASLVPAADKPHLVHHTDVAAQGSHCAVVPRYEATGQEGPAPQSTADHAGMSLVHGGDQKGNPRAFSFVQAMEEAAHTEHIFIGHAGQRMRITGKVLLQRARRLLAGLRMSGLVCGDGLIVFCPDQTDIVALFWASLLGGLRLTIFLPPVEGQAPEPVLQRLEHIMTALGSPALVTTHGQRLPGNAGAVLHVEELESDTEAEPSPAGPEGLIYMAFTSGSTGKPKAVPLAARNIAAMLMGKSQRLGRLEDETLLSMTSLDHVASLFAHCFLGTLRKARQVFCPVQHILADPCRILDLTTEFRITRTWAPEFLWRQLRSSVERLERPRAWDLSSLTHVFSGGEPTREKTFTALEEALASHGLRRGVLANAWGMSETSSFFTIAAPWRPGQAQVHASIVDAGTPLPGMSMRIVDARGQVVPQGRIGSLEVAGAAVIDAYHDNPAANAKDFSADGWFRTGDLALIVNDQLILYGREKEILIIRGQNLSQVEIEGAVEALPGVVPGFTAALACRDSATRQEEVLLFCSTDLHTPEETAALIRSIQSVLSLGFGVTPRHVIPVSRSDIPKSGLGKIQRAALLKRFLAGGFAGACRKADLLLANERTMPDWFAAPTWIPETLHKSLEIDLRSWSFVLVGPDTPLRAPLQEALQSLGVEVVHRRTSGAGRDLNPANADHWADLVGTAGRQTGIVLLVPEEQDGRENGGLDDERFGRWLETGIRPVFYALKLLVRKELPEPALVCAVTVRGLAVKQAGSSPCSPGAALISGLLAAHRRQNIHHRVLHLDIDRTPESDKEALRRTAAALAADLCASTARSVVAFRGGQRLAQALAPLNHDPAKAGCAWEKPFRPDGFCVCTGGLGTVGQALLPQVLAYTEARLLIIGRTEEAHVQDRIKALTAGTKADRVRYVQADLVDCAALDRAMEGGCRHFGCQPTGVLHLAADTSPSHMGDLGFDVFAKAALETRRALENFKRSFEAHGGSGPFLNFSTVFSRWGERGFGTYGACSALKEALIHNWAARNPGAFLSAAWTLWMRENRSEEDHMQRRVLAQRGFLSIAPRQGFVSMIALLQRGSALALAGLDHSNPAIAADMRTRASLARRIRLEGIRREPGYPLTHPLCPDLPAGLMLAKADIEARHSSSSLSATENRMAAVWKEVLGLEHLDVRGNFFELGGSSVLLPRLRAKVLKTFGVDIGATGIFQHASVREMARAVDGSAHSDNRDAPDLDGGDGASARRAEAQRAARQRKRPRAAADK
ncbi:Acyl-CoA synthetase (AMP-forming)/AMP-acid ligase II [Humidesulfovibrio mexicanus]|uniref:Acyl-CoA synthetase (AMP-forming)/AMP-acid ligase II n=1 Tax=Humidesulfovibrio mexicanus TaxID=147047 RepID=A0A239BLC2_9BACT|nr:condensation domain-containing protein [Humidesulfovibrio mexicanus]SNS08389.1 Acyl-CoA synthetase (AMP-forming)/AMP-acid ligase II [Humidesulfovibrio mexicanus]